ncbi:MAG TPA: peptidoglycan-associated lipoprotein Pal [Thermoanaerobaculia bacterium]|nr:peptidoglycan-associated lipoprotein Pal [Thermoanaerobaculia bacterium]
MKKMWKVFLGSLVIIAITIVPACKPKKPPTPPQPPQETVDTTPPPPVAPPPTPVETPKDFVTDTAPQESELPRDIDKLNDYVQTQGLIRDAFFSYDESALTSEAQAALTTSATWLKANPNYNLLVQGHCDERGTEQYNLALGDRRANIAKEYLATLGVDASRIRTVSYGEERPFDEGHDESAFAQNRRAHLVLVNR